MATKDDKILKNNLLLITGELFAVALVIFLYSQNNLNSLLMVKAQSGRVINLTVNANKIAGKYNRLYEGINFMRHYPTYEKPLSKNELAGFKEIGFKYVRLMLPLTKIAPEEGKFYWGIEGYRMAQLTRNGVEILVSPNYIPAWLSTCGKPNQGLVNCYLDINKIQKYKKLIRDILYHYKVEKGYNIKYFDVFNEYNGYHWSPDELGRIYEATVEAVKSVDNSILVGGPGTTGSPSKMKKFFTVLMDLNKNKNVPLDFISWHNYYSRRKPSMIVNDVNLVKKWLKERNINVPIFLTEWAEAGGGDKVDRLAFSVWSAISIYYQELSGIDKSFIWELFNPSPFTMMEYDYSGKPTYGFWVYKLLSMLKDNLIFSHSDGLNDESSVGVGAIATRDKKNIAILIWNYKNNQDINLKIRMPIEFVGENIDYKRFVVNPYIVRAESPYESNRFKADRWFSKKIKDNKWAGVNLVVLTAENVRNIVKGDVNNDNMVNIKDLGIILSNWGKKDFGDYDIDQDGTVNSEDFALFFEKWQN